MRTFLINQSKTKTFTDIRVTRKPVRPVNPTKNSTWPYLNEFPAHFIHEIKKAMTSSALIYPAQVNEIPAHKTE